MKKIHIIGGGTFYHVRNHLALAAPAFGETARTIQSLCHHRFRDMDINLHLTKMAFQYSNLVTNEDVDALVGDLIKDLDTKIIFFNAAMCDFNGNVEGYRYKDEITPSGKHEERLSSKDDDGVHIILKSAPKVISQIRKNRKDICLIAFKTTCGATEQEQYLAGLDLLKKNSCNLVLANDVVTRKNMIITPEEAKYHITTDRQEALAQLVDMAFHRSQLSFTRSTVVAGEPIPWNSELVFPVLRQVVDYCIQKGAYKPFNGATVGHFACKIGEREFITSIRKSNFNDLAKNGLVRVVTNDDDTVIAYGAKPSVGGQSQRIVFNEHAGYNCILHFHCPLKKNHRDDIPVVSQREYECGSHQCGENTSRGLKQIGNALVVMLDNHGPNIIFKDDIDINELIDLIEANFDLADKTGGLVELKNVTHELV